MKYIFDMVSGKTSRMTTQSYSTSFSLGIRVFHKKFHAPIYAIYGFVRFADEIVDSFDGYDKAKLLAKFKADTFEAISEGISLNPIINSFQWVVNKYGIEQELIHLFLKSMEMDLEQKEHTQESFQQYILGSAEVVGLMCLTVFTQGNQQQYQQLKPAAMALGSAFQKVNFMRDLKADSSVLGRSYFPGLDLNRLDEHMKQLIIADIELDFAKAYEGIKKLPTGSRFGVYVAYVYYLSLLRKIKRTGASTILAERIRIPDSEKYSLLLRSALKHAFNML
jgi:phytoene/squalene synthetase